MEICIKWNICRVCLLEEPKTIKRCNDAKDQMRHLFEDKKLVLHIYALFGVFMKPGDSLPDRICLKCLSVINKAIKLRKICRSSNSYLQSVLERTKSASTLFKPEALVSQVSDDEVENEIRNLEKTEFEYDNDDKPKINPTEGCKKIKEDLEAVENLEAQENSENKLIVPGTPVEMEELIEITQEIEEEMVTQAKYGAGEENSRSLGVKVNSFSKLKTTKEGQSNSSSPSAADDLKTGENDTDDQKESNDELYKIFKELQNENSHNESEDVQNGEYTVTTKDLQFVTVEEDAAMESEIDETMLQFQKVNRNENQAQVSSTVDTNDEIGYYEPNSNDSNIESDLEEEQVVEKSFNNCDISRSKRQRLSEETDESHSNVNKIETNSAHGPAENRKSLVTFPKRKARRNSLKLSPHSELKLSICEICGNQFTNRNLLNVHMKVHFREKNHQCELCLKRFITACNLQAHMRTHTGEKPFECKYCSRRFSDRSSNLRHERTHTNEKPFECASCGKSFSLATTLQNHMKVHTNERSYRCEPCGKSFKLAHHLKTHQNTTLHRSMAQVGAGGKK